MRFGRRHDPDTAVVRKGLRTYRIPVDEDGLVPDWALVSRFQEKGQWDDLEDGSQVVVPSGRTPEEIVDWWINPSVYDIDGIDTPDSPYYDVSSVPDNHKRVQRKIAVLADRDEQARIRRILTESFTVDGKERVLSAADEEELAIFIENAFSLEELVFLDGSTLFYVTDDIIASHDSYGVGTLVEAVDSSGRTRALMEVTDSDGAINLYSTIYEKDLVAGLNLRRGPSFSLSLRALSMMPPSSFAFALDFSYLPHFAYFNPVVSLLISYDGLLSYYGGLGIEARFPLERLIRTHFTLIEDASIGASAMLYLGYDGAFSVGADFSAFYEHHISSRTYWRLGYETGTMINNAIMLSFGVLF